MALSESKIRILIREISLKDRPESLYEISPKGTVPVLQINENKVIEESLEIMMWAIKKYKLSWLDYSTEEQLALITINDKDFKRYLDKYKYTDKTNDNKYPEYQNYCGKFLEKYDKILKNKSYFFGEKYQLADVAMFPFIRQCAHIDSIWFENNFINLYKWLEKMKTSRLFLSAMNKYDTWDKISEGELVNFQIIS